MKQRKLGRGGAPFRKRTFTPFGIAGKNTHLGSGLAKHEGRDETNDNEVNEPLPREFITHKEPPLPVFFLL